MRLPAYQRARAAAPSAQHALLRRIYEQDVFLLPGPEHTRYRRVMSGWLVRAGFRPPRGWKLERDIGRDAYIARPWPLWLVHRAWAHRWEPVDWLIRAGVLDVEAGEYYRNARPRCPSWLWCFVHDRDRDPRLPRWMGGR